MIAKYNAETKARLRTLIRELSIQGKSRSEIFTSAVTAGIKAPDGTKLLPKYIAWYIKEAESEHGPVTSRCPRTVAGILTDPALNASQKVSMLMAYYELR